MDFSLNKKMIDGRCTGVPQEHFLVCLICLKPLGHKKRLRRVFSFFLFLNHDRGQCVVQVP